MTNPFILQQIFISFDVILCVTDVCDFFLIFFQITCSTFMIQKKMDFIEVIGYLDNRLLILCYANKISFNLYLQNDFHDDIKKDISKFH